MNIDRWDRIRQLFQRVLEQQADDPERHLRLLREARAAASLNHPNICTIHEVGETIGSISLGLAAT